MSCQRINPTKAKKRQANGKRKYELENFFMPSFPIEKDGNSILFDAEFEKTLLDEAKIEDKKRLDAWLSKKRVNNVPADVKEVFVEQGSKEWLLLRKGLVTASKPCFDSKGLPIPTFDAYVNKKVADKFEAEMMGETLIDEDLKKEFKNEAMQNGNKLEDTAIERYEKLTGNSVTRKGFIKFDNCFGVSHDGITTDENFNKINVEVKNLITNRYLSQLLHGTAERDYYAQMQMQMYVLDCDLTHFVIQCQREEKLGVEMELLIVEIKRDEEFIFNMMETLDKFEITFNERYELLKSKVLA